MDDLLREIEVEKERISDTLKALKEALGRSDKTIIELLAFRHFFTHGYGIMLEEEKLIPLAENVSDLWHNFELAVGEFIKGLEKKGKN